MDQFVDSQDGIVVVAQEICEKIQDDFDAFDFQCSNDVHALFLTESMKHRLINK